jgi:hypothetical protein
VLEGSRNVYWPLTAWQNLMYFGRLKSLRAAEVKPRAERLLSDLGLWDRRDETVGSYSRGMQQKVAIAAALITDPPILLLDEPTIGLDVEAARTVRDWIAHLAAEEGKTIVLTTHQLAIVQELAGRIAVIRGGSVIADLPTRELLSRFAEDRFEVRVTGPLDGFAGKLPAGARAEADVFAFAALPVFTVPGWFADLGRVFPLTSPVTSLYGVMLGHRGVTGLWGTGGLVGLIVTAAAYLAAGITVFRVLERITKVRGTLGAY